MGLHGRDHVLRADGNAPISAFVHAVKQLDGVPDFRLLDYDEGTRGHSADAEGICFIRIAHDESNQGHIGVGIGSNIDQAAARAVVAALNAMLEAEATTEP
mgnify:FL=1